MAARKHIAHDENTRKKIQASQLINRLTKHALGDLELSTSQIKAIEILLKKTLPDLQSIQHSGDKDNPIDLRWKVDIVDAPSPDTK